MDRKVVARSCLIIAYSSCNAENGWRFCGQATILNTAVQMSLMKNAKQNATLMTKGAHELRANLARRIASFLGKEENRITEISGLSLHRRTSPTPPCRTTYHPGIIVVAQGSKQANRGGATFTYDESRFLLTAVDLPVVTWGRQSN